MKLKLGISPCPNDTYIYEALVTGQMKSEFDWDVTFADVQTLNEMVKRGELDVAKVSCGVVPQVLDAYQVLSCGGAIGYSCGPLLLASGIPQAENPQGASAFDLSRLVVLPGEDTTAALIFRFWASRELPEKPQIEYALFDAVYRSLRNQEFRQGVVIHEHRFTWKRDGLTLIQDLGDYWESVTKIPVPLGCTLMRKSFSSDLVNAVESEIRQSIDIARARKQIITDFIRKKAQIDEDTVMEKHIHTFVTDFSYDINKEGRKALQNLFEVSAKTL